MLAPFDRFTHDVRIGHMGLKLAGGIELLLPAGERGLCSPRYRPVLNVTGLQDRVFFNSADVDELYARLAKAARLDMADADHMIPVERPDSLAQAMLDFAAKLASGAFAVA